MIGLVEQLLVHKPSSPSQPVVGDEQPSKDAPDKETGFLAMLVQLFGSMIHPSAQKPEIAAEASGQVDEAAAQEASAFPILAEQVGVQPSENGSAEPVLFSPYPSRAASLPVLAEKPQAPPEVLLSSSSDITEPPVEQASKTEAPDPVGVRSAPRQEQAPLPAEHLKTRTFETASEPIGARDKHESQHVQAAQTAAVRAEQSLTEEDVLASLEQMPSRTQMPGPNIPEADSSDPKPVPVSARTEIPLPTTRKQAAHAEVLPHTQHISDQREREPVVLAEVERTGERAPEDRENQKRAQPVGEPEIAAAFPVDWSKMKLSVRGIPAVHQFTPAETTAALKAVAESFTVGRTHKVQNDSTISAEREAAKVAVAETSHTLPVINLAEDTREGTREHADVQQENTPPVAADISPEDSIPDWSKVQITRKEQPEQQPQTSQVVAGTTENIGMQTQQAKPGQGNEAVVGREVPGKATSVAVSLPENFARDVVVKMADELRLHVAGGTSEVRVRLKPEHLGELSLKITMQEGELTARMDVSVPAVKAALDAQLPQLREALASQGIEIRRFDVVADGQGNAQHEQRRFHHHQQQTGRHTDVDVTEMYAAMRDLGYNTVEYII
jgi:flagellar hook-length control protein FliK